MFPSPSKVKSIVCYTVGVCLICVVYYYFKSILLPGIQTRKISKGANDQILDSRQLLPQKSTDSLFSNFFERVKNLKHTLLHKKDKSMLSKTSSPFINPVFHVDMSFNVASKHHVDHVILFLESPDWFKQWSNSSNIGQCMKYTNCRQSFDRSALNRSKAVVFNLPDMNADKYPPLRSNPDQAWVFFTLESPLHINPSFASHHWHNVFNWSWTYHPRADIFHPYGVLVKQNNLPQRNYSNILRKKTKFAAWVVSNCNAPSGRNEYVKILQQFVKVDVFGRCGKKAPEDLEIFLSENYKFYLSFENSLCENYITEKFFHYYKLDVITVLRGHSNYKEYLPNGSYINTADFSSIFALARFMKDLGENEEKYVSYLKIKDKYYVYEREFLFKDALCNLCEKVNNIEKNRKMYGDIYNWLGPCFAAKDLVINLSSTFDFTR